MSVQDNHPTHCLDHRGFLYWKNFLAALPCFITSVSYIFPGWWLNRQLGLGEKELNQLMYLEVYALMAFPLIFFAGLDWGRTFLGKVIRAVMFCLFLLICLAVYKISGRYEHVIGFFGLTLVTYFGLFLQPASHIPLLVMRFIVALLAYGMAFRTGSGALYFMTLGVIEWSGFYQSEWIKSGYVRPN